MSMRSGVALGVGLVAVFLHVFLSVEMATGRENNSASFSFVQQAKLTQGTKVAEDQFGAGVAVEEDTALIGVPGDDSKGFSAGAVYVFRRNDEGAWQQTQKLTASNGTSLDFFGASVALNGDVALIGARGAAPHGNFSGSVYVFTRGTDGKWTQAQILSADEGAVGNFFGWSVAVSGDTAIIGARGNGDDSNFPGAAYVFTRGADGKWTQTQTLSAADGAGGDEFGYSVAVLESVALIGARGENAKGSLAGAAYLFSRDAGGLWTQQQKLTASDGVAGDEFGYSVALLEKTAIVGARFAAGEVSDRETPTHTGAVYVYEPTQPDGAVWEETQKLLSSEGVDGSQFGSSVAASGDSLIIGSPNEIVNGPAVGAAYLFTRTQATETSTIWQEQQKILSIDGAGGDAFGFSLAVNGEIAIIGSPLDDIVVEDTDETDSTDTATTFTNNGSAHILVMTSRPPICPVKTDYEDAKCSDTFFVASLTDLDAYVANDFGRADNDGKYKHLNVTANLSAAFLLLQSPCEIILDAGVSLSGEFVIIDGRQGVSGGRPRIEAKKVCVLSEQGNVSPGDDAVIEVGELTLQAGGGAIIGDDATVTVDGALTIETVGDAESSAAVIDSGAVVSAGSLLITSPRAVQIREEARISVDGVLSLISTQDNSESEAVVEENIQIQATDLTISSPRKAEIGKGTSITLFGNGELVSGSEAVVNKNVTIYVVGNFRMEAADAGQCEISGSAQISAGTKSGNCF